MPTMEVYTRPNCNEIADNFTCLFTKVYSYYIKADANCIGFALSQRFCNYGFGGLLFWIGGLICPEVSS